MNISLGTNGGAHDGSSGVSRWLDAYLAAPGRAICIAAGNAGQEKAQTEGDLGWIMGRIHSQGRVPSRGLEVELEWTVVGDGIEDRSRERARDLVRLAGSLRRGGEATRRQRLDPVGPREYVENYRLPSGTTLSIYNELYHPTNGAQLSRGLSLAEPGSQRLPRHRSRRLEGAPDRRGGARRALQRLDRTGRSRRARTDRRTAVLQVPVLFHRGDQHRLALHQLSRVRTSRHRRVEPRRRPAADQRQQQSGSDARWQVQAGNRRARHRHRRGQRLRASRRAMGGDDAARAWPARTSRASWR